VNWNDLEDFSSEDLVGKDMLSYFDLGVFFPFVACWMATRSTTCFSEHNPGMRI